MTLAICRFLVLDEADRILNLDFEEEVTTILRALPTERTTYLYSATMTSKVSKLQRASLSDPVKVGLVSRKDGVVLKSGLQVEASSKYATPKLLKQEYIFIPAKHKDTYLCYLLNEIGSRAVIVFIATCKNCQRVALMLAHLGFSVTALHGKVRRRPRAVAPRVPRYSEHAHR